MKRNMFSRRSALLVYHGKSQGRTKFLINVKIVAPLKLWSGCIKVRRLSHLTPLMTPKSLISSVAYYISPCLLLRFTTSLCLKIRISLLQKAHQTTCRIPGYHCPRNYGWQSWKISRMTATRITSNTSSQHVLLSVGNGKPSSRKTPSEKSFYMLPVWRLFNN